MSMREVVLFCTLACAASAGAADVTFVRSTSGTRGEVRAGRFVVEDPRTSFQAGVDRQVVVFFEWDAPPGRHRCEGTWRDPSGRIVLVQPTEQESRGRRFGVYWTLALPDTPPTGLWALETTVDGVRAGTHAFEVVEGPVAAGSAGHLSPRPRLRRRTGVAGLPDHQALTVAGPAIRADE